MAMSTALMNCSLSLRTASLSSSPVLGQSKVYVRSDGSSIFGRSAACEAEALGEADVAPPVSAPAILSLSAESPSPPPHPVRTRAVTAAKAAVANKGGRRFTADSCATWGSRGHRHAIGGTSDDTRANNVNRGPQLRHTHPKYAQPTAQTLRLSDARGQDASPRWPPQGIATTPH